MRLIILAKYLSYAAVVAALVVCWRVDRANARLAGENADLRSRQAAILAGVNRPILIRGLTVPLLDQVQTLDSYLVGRADAFPRQLILIYREHCGACDRQFPSWKRLVADPRMRNIETWLVSVGEGRAEAEPILEVLRGRKLPYRLLKAKNPEVFAITIGLRGLPATIVARGQGADSAIELLQEGLIEQQRLDAFLSAVSGEATVLGARVLPDGQMNSLFGVEEGVAR
jgi:hypothetical protein